MAKDQWVDDVSEDQWVDDAPNAQQESSFFGIPTARQLGKTLTEALPLAGGALGGVVGAVGGPVGSVAGAGLGAAGGKALENIIESQFFDEPKTTRQLFVEPAVEGLQGAAGEMGGQIASKGLQMGLQSFQPKIASEAERMAARALGAERGTIKKLGADKIQQVGRYALDENLLSPLASTDDVVAANLAAQQRGGKMMGDVYKAIDEANASTFNPLEVAGKVDKELGGFYRDPLNKGVTNQLENTLESILMRGDKPIPIVEAQKLKETLGRAANWKNNLVVTEKEKLAREAYSIVNQAIDEAVDTGSKAIGTDKIVQNLQRGKELFGNSKTAEELLTNKFAREQGNKLMGLTDTIATSQAMSTAGPAGIAAYPLKRGLEAYGAQNMALQLDKLSKSLLQSPYMQEIQRANPSLFKQFVSRMTQQLQPKIQDQPQEQESKPIDKNKILEKAKGSKYAGALQNAANNGDQSFNAAHYVLYSQPEYRQMLEDQEQ